MRPQFNNLPRLRTFRRKLRHNLTPAEAFLWGYLKGSKFHGRKFRRQHSVGNYILDFYCPDERLGIELDGEVHHYHGAWGDDNKRKQFLNDFGVRIIRFENKLVFEETDWVLAVIESNFGWAERTTPSAT